MKEQLQRGADRAAHWGKVYTKNDPGSVSWFQGEPRISLAMIERSGIPMDEAVIDVGGGASRLAGHLLDRGFTDISVLDVSDEGMAHARELLGARAVDVRWIVSDVTAFTPERKFALWHDRAVLHFLTAQEDRGRYAAVLRAALRPGGQCVIGAFAPDGPLRCSGLDVQQYDGELLCETLGPDFHLVEEFREDHVTPAGKPQRFTWCRLEFDPAG